MAAQAAPKLDAVASPVSASGAAGQSLGVVLAANSDAEGKLHLAPIAEVLEQAVRLLSEAMYMLQSGDNPQGHVR